MLTLGANRTLKIQDLLLVVGLVFTGNGSFRAWFVISLRE